MNAEKLFGIPVQTFTSIEPAIDWIVARLTGKSIMTDTGMVRRTLLNLLVQKIVQQITRET